MDVPPSLIICLFLVSPPCLTHARQPYVGKATTGCGTTDDSTTALGYACKGLKTTCQAFVALTLRSQSPNITVSSISSLFNSDPSRVSRINSIPDDSSIRETDELVIFRVKCSCSGGQYYQSNTHYFVHQDDSYFPIANNVFQGPSTCQARKAHNSAPATGLLSGDRIGVPLRCACPTKNQSDNGVKYLLSYSVTWNQDVSDWSTIFGADYRSVLEANELLSDPKIYGFPTILIPLQIPSNKILNEIHYQYFPFKGYSDIRNRHLLTYWPMQSDVLRLQSTSPQTPALALSPRFGPNAYNSSNKTWVFVVVGVLGGIGVLLVIGRIGFVVFFRGRNVEEC